MQLPKLIDFFATKYSNVKYGMYDHIISFDISELKDGIANDIKDKVKSGIFYIDRGSFVMMDKDGIVLRVLLLVTLNLIDITEQFIESEKEVVNG